ncbi:hypothetical protein [Streptomyces sp. RKAG293]|uniref:hypothetical protein n=1 Tax=Streptomyces sp. RKAG293 TaxID=2893403 RepID=UPI00203484C6|nr:hypothetical protein [Streptomyces sp. RKAG293]MCM2424182.1 hypothetical protein [Streptomyces sp. RKAG293]
MSQTHTQRLRAEQQKRRDAKDQAEREAAAAATGAPPAEPPTGTESGSGSSGGSPAVLPEKVPAARRPQPFTADLLPSTEAVDASGELSAEELDELDRCERALANADQAQWMRGMAIHALRERKLFRENGRTWPEYCEEIGLSESDANRMILEYPLARAIAQIWATPRMVPASHVRALLPLVPKFDLDGTAQGYVKLRAWAQENGQRVTATLLTSMIEQTAIAGRPSDTPLPVAEFVARIKALDAGVPAQASPPATKAAADGGPQDVDNPNPSSHPNLGDSSAPEGSRLPDHPNLGDVDDADRADDPDLVDAEIVDEEWAQAINEALTELSHGIEGKLAGASPEVLKGIAAAATTILNAAQDALGDR